MPGAGSLGHIRVCVCVYGCGGAGAGGSWHLSLWEFSELWGLAVLRVCHQVLDMARESVTLDLMDQNGHTPRDL